VAVSINKNNLTHSYISASKVFSASLLCAATPLPFIGRFGFRSGRDIDKLEGVKYKIGTTGAPVVLDNAVAYIEARVVKQFDVGTHTLFVGEVQEAEVLSESEECMTYTYYQQVKRGTTPRQAPTYVAQNQEAKPG
jgi:ferric-chelate reductase [NAD(P)H]